MPRLKKNAATITYKKECECPANATTNCCRFRTEEVPAGETMVKFSISVVPGFSCDRCGKAWSKTDSRKEKMSNTIKG